MQMRNINNNNNSKKPPLLMTCHGLAFEKQSFYSLKEKGHHTTSIPMFTRKHLLGSGYGWLVLVDLTAGDCCLWNPETAETIQLPRLHKPLSYNLCVLSKPPTEPDCLVVFNKPTSVLQCVCRIGDEKYFEYSPVETKLGFLVAMYSFQGEIYGILRNVLIRYEFVTIHLLVGETTCTVEFKPLLINGQQYWEPPQLGRDWIKWRRSYLIESTCSGELLFVTKLFYGVVEFRVFRVNLNEMTCSEELDNIDGLTIFIARYGKGFCCSAETAGSKPNCIYYTEERGRVVRVYDLDDRSTTVLVPPSPVAHPHVFATFWVDLPDILLASAVRI